MQLVNKICLQQACNQVWCCCDTAVICSSYICPRGSLLETHNLWFLTYGILMLVWQNADSSNT